MGTGRRKVKDEDILRHHGNGGSGIELDRTDPREESLVL